MNTAAMPLLPPDVKAYKRTRLFTPETLPQALQQNHTTKEGVWGCIHVVSGAVKYVRDGCLPYVLRPGDLGVILPAEPHNVCFVEEGVFFIEFHSASG